MQMRTLAFLTRSLRQESRLVSHHFMRGLLALVVIVLFTLQAMAASRVGAAGSFFAWETLLCVYWFLTLIGGIYFSTAIVEEKEEETLPLLRMTGASTFSILIGKSLPRLAVALLFLLVIAPFLLLAITLGGVLPYGLVSAILGLLIYSVMLCQLGVFCSVLSRDAQRAFSGTVMLWGVFEFANVWTWLGSQAMKGLSGIPWSVSATEYVQTHDPGGPNWDVVLCLKAHLLLQSASEWLSVRTMLGSLGSQLNAIDVSGIWHPQMTFQLLVAVGFFLISWSTFNLFTSRFVGEGAAAVVKPQKKNGRRTSRRVTGAALMWKSWRLQAGGWRWFWLRLVGTPLLVTVLFFLTLAAIDERFDLEGLAVSLMFAGAVVLVVNVARLLGNVFNSEVYGKTLNSLLMLPRTRGQVLRPLVAGLAPALAASTSCFLLGMMFMAMEEPYFWDDLVDFLTEPWFYQFLIWIVTTAHVGMLLSIYTRYGGMLIAIAVMWFLAPMMFFATVGAFAMLAGPGRWYEDFMQYLVPLMLMPASLFMCVICQKLILRRVEVLGAQS